MAPFNALLRIAAVAFAAVTTVAPLHAPAADRSTDGGVVIFATTREAHGVGAGTVISSDGARLRILTAKHVATFGTLSVALGDGTLAAATVERLVPGRDLAIVEADVSPETAAAFRPARLAPAASNAVVHVWGSGTTGPALEPGVVSAVGTPMPDGTEPGGRYELACRLCHRGDSGAGVFDGGGRLVGVYVGYFTVAGARIQVAEATQLR